MKRNKTSVSKTQFWIAMLIISVIFNSHWLLELRYNSIQSQRITTQVNRLDVHLNNSYWHNLYTKEYLSQVNDALVKHLGTIISIDTAKFYSWEAKRSQNNDTLTYILVTDIRVDTSWKYAPLCNDDVANFFNRTDYYDDSYAGTHNLDGSLK